MEAARTLHREVAIATGTPAELYRGAGRSQALDALLARESGDGLLLRDTDRALARLIRALLAEAGAGSGLFADAHPVAVAVEAGGGVVQTAYPDDLPRLAAPSHHRHRATGSEEELTRLKPEVSTSARRIRPAAPPPPGAPPISYCAARTATPPRAGPVSRRTT